MSAEIHFELLSIDITDEYFPSHLAKMNVKGCDHYTWNYTFSFSFSPYTAGYERVCFSMGFDLIDKDDPEGDPIAWLEIDSNFKFTTAGITNAHKATLMHTFLKLTAGHIQGIYAVKFEKTPFAAILPPELNPDKYHDYIIKEIKNENS